MAKDRPPHQSQTREELQAHLREQNYFLTSSCNAFDKGQTSESKRIASRLRVLLHDTRHSLSLLGQIGLKNRMYYDSSMKPEEGGQQMFAPLLLVGRLASNHIHAYIPYFGLPQSEQELRFDDWWDQVVIVDAENNQFSRKLIVLSIADRDGGAHVDAELDESYYKLTRLNSVQDYQVFAPIDATVDQLLNATPVAPKVSPAFYTVRQIAHELLVSLLDYKHIPPTNRTVYTYDESQYDGAGLAFGGIY